MSRLPWKTLLNRKMAILGLSLAALACLPLASRELVPDAAMGLLLPFTIAGIVSAWALGSLSQARGWQRILLAVGGPLLLLLYIGHVWQPLVQLAKLSLLLLPEVLEWHHAPQLPEAASWLTAFRALTSQVMLIANRVALWIESALRGGGNEDPTARALVWGSGLWWLSAWGGWQIRRHARPLEGLIPAGFLLCLVLNSSSTHRLLLWIFISALVLLMGLAKYEQHLRAWRQAGHDYVELADLYWSVSIFVITVLLVGSAYVASSTSIEEILDRLQAEEPAETGGGSPVTATTQPRSPLDNRLDTDELLNPHRILAGPHLTEDVVMMVSTGELPRMPASARPAVRYYYWRTITYERYSAGGWSNPPVRLQEIPAGQDLLETPVAGARSIPLQVQFPAGSTGRLYWTNTLVHVDVPIQAAWHAAAEGDLLSAFSPEQSYTAESVQAWVSPGELRAASMDYPDWVHKRYLDLPATTPERVLGLARDLTASAATAYDRAVAIQAYLRRLPYSLEVPAPPPGRDAVDFFLFDLKKGYCDYYATAMVVLSRAAGLPARFVTGYASGVYDPESASYRVRQADAHSWAEIYFAGVGWVEFEATGSRPLPAWQAEEGKAAIPSRENQATSGLVEAFHFLRRGMGWAAALAFLMAACLLLFWEPVRTSLAARYRSQAAPGIFYRALRQAALPLTGPLASSQTVREYRLDLVSRLAELERPHRKWVRAATEELELLSRLYSASLFCMHQPGREQVLAGAHAWSRLRWRLWAAGLLYRFRKKGTAGS